MFTLRKLLTSQRGEAQSHAVYAVTFTIIAVVALVGLIMVNSEADDSTQTADIPNAMPIMGALTIATTSGGPSITSWAPTAEGTTTNIYVRATVTDNSGCGDIDAVTNYSGVFFRSDVSGGSSCSENPENCYVGSSSDMTVSSCSSGQTVDVEWTEPIQYYVDATCSTCQTNAATDWTAKLTVTDDADATASNSTTVEIEELTAINVSPSVTYSALTLGSTSEGDSLIEITPTGNDDSTDYKFYGEENFTCSVRGSFPVSNSKYSTSRGTAFSEMTSIPVAANEVTIDANIPKGPGNSATLYTKLTVPATNVRGTCTNNLTFTAA